MSGICAIVDLTREVTADQLQPIMAKLEWRARDGADMMAVGQVAMGRQHRHATPESAGEVLPQLHEPTGCLIVGDLRLDNREELAEALGLIGRLPGMGDGELALLAFLEWGTDCPSHLLGDFAFVIWDPRERRVFAARDHMGLRPLHYALPRAGLLVIASDARAVVAHPEVPSDLDERRIADFLDVPAFDDDRSLSFFAAAKRLPAAHSMVFDTSGVSIRRYWSLEPQEPSHLSAREAQEQFREIFGRAVKARLRHVGGVGVLMSGGIDSGSVAAMAAIATNGPLRSYSMVDGQDPGEIETRMIGLLIDHLGLEATRVDYQSFGGEARELAASMEDLEEPFDWEKVLASALYSAAARQGTRVMIDGVLGDTTFAVGDVAGNALRHGHVLKAWRHLSLQAELYGGHGATEFARAAFRAFLPAKARSFRASVRQRVSAIWPHRRTLAARSFAAEQVQVTLERARKNPIATQPPRADIMTAAHLSAAREVFERVSARYGIDARDPFADVRVLRFVVSLDPTMISPEGVPKGFLRAAMAGMLPAAFVARRSKEHLGWRSISSLAGQSDFPGMAPLPSFTRLESRSNSAKQWDALRLKALARWLETPR